jgi:hypothetical protein
MSDTTGAIFGTPTVAGSSTVSVQVSDSKGSTASTTLMLTVTILPLSVKLSLPDGKQGSNYSGGITVSGGVPPYKQTITGLPPGLSVSSTNAVTGQPTTAGSFNVSVQVTDSQSTPATASAQATVNIASTPLTITNTHLPGGTAGQPYSASTQVIGGTLPYTYSAALPGGLTIDPATGVISGTPTVGGQATITITVTDSTGTKATFTDTVTFALPPPGSELY